MEDNEYFDIVPDGYDWGTPHLLNFNIYFSIAMFNWDEDCCSKKLLIDEDDQLTIKVKDGSGFKTSLGN
jgi:hypothetical protein